MRRSQSPDVAVVLRGLPLGVAAYVVACIAFGAVELTAYPSHLSAWVLANGTGVGFCGLGLWGRGRVRTVRQARALAVCLNLTNALIITGYTIVAGGSWPMLASGLLLLVAGLALLFPLGVRAQAVAAGGVVVIYAAALALLAPADVTFDLTFVALVTAAGLTVVGAYVSEYSRREVTAAREALRTEADVATTLIEIGRELNATLSRAEVLRRLAERAVDVFGAPIGAINLIDDAHRLRIVEVCGLPEEAAQAAREMYLDLDTFPGAAELVLQPLIELPDIAAQHRLPPLLLQLFGYSGLLIAPIRRGPKAIGAITFVYPEPRPPFTTRERQLARGLAEQAALALENARLYEEQHESAEIALGLVRVAETLGSSLDPQHVAAHLANLAAELLRCDTAAVYRWQDGSWRLAATVNPRPGVDPHNELEFRDGDVPFFRELRRTGLVELADIDNQDLVSRELLKRWGIRSNLTALLARGADPLGLVVVAHTTRTGPFSLRERRILSGLAQLGVVALTNAQLAEQLRSASRVKSEFVSTMSHELRTPLNAILGYTDLLRDGTLGPVAVDQADALDRIRARSLDLLELVQATLDLNRLEAGATTVERHAIRIGEFVEGVRGQIPAGWLKPEVQLDLRAESPDFEMWTDAGKLHAVARNLIHNALKFTSRGAVQMLVRPDHGAEVVIEVCDTGCGIPAQKLGEIFDMFVQVGGASAHDGVGLGLHLSRRYVTLLGGSIDVDSRVGEGSTFRVRLPVSKPLNSTFS